MGIFNIGKQDDISDIYNGETFISQTQNDDETVTYDAYDGGSSRISKEFIKKLFEDKVAFEKLKEVIENQSKGKKIEYPNTYTIPIKFKDRTNEADGFTYDYNIPLAYLVAAAHNALDKTATSKTKKRLHEIETLVSYKSILKNGKNYKFAIDNEYIIINESEFISILLEDDQKLIKRCETDPQIRKKLYSLSVYADLTKEEGVPALFKSIYFPNNTITKIFERYDDILSSKYADIEPFNRVKNNRKEISSKFSVNNELKNAVYKDMPDDLDNMEKMIYVYGRLCQLLAYDPDYWVKPTTYKMVDGALVEEETNKKEDIHKNIMRLSTITPENNKVVCYEFAHLFAKLVEPFGICVDVVSKYNQNPDYSSGHRYCLVRVDDTIFKVDSTENFFHSDLIRAKYGNDLQGIRPQTEIDDKRVKFMQALQKVTPLLEEARQKLPLSLLAKQYTILNNDQKEPPLGIHGLIDILNEIPADTDIVTKVLYANNITRLICSGKNNKNIKEPENQLVDTRILARDNNLVFVFVSGDDKFYEYGYDKNITIHNKDEFISLINTGSITPTNKDDRHGKQFISDVVKDKNNEKQESI